MRDEKVTVVTGQTLSSESTTSRVIAALRELIRALDRRVPHAARAGEPRIARDAHSLRHSAIARIAALTRGELPDARFNQELVEAIMTDDGSPTRE